MFKANNNARHRSGVFIVNFEQVNVDWVQVFEMITTQTWFHKKTVLETAALW